jgi:hypothetical protein
MIPSSSSFGDIASKIHMNSILCKAYILNKTTAKLHTNQAMTSKEVVFFVQFQLNNR